MHRPAFFSVATRGSHDPTNGIWFIRLALPLWLAMSAAPLLASSGIWSNTATTGAWQSAGNWDFGDVPGATTGTTNADTATFNSAGNGQTTITPDAGRNLENITFDTSAAAYTIGATNGNSLFLTAGGTTQIASTFSGSDVFETIAAPMVLEGNYSFAVNTSNSFDILFTNGAISSGAAGTQTLTFGGVGTVDADGAIGGGSGTIAIVKNGAGGLGLNTPNTFTGGLTINAGNVFLQSAGALNSTTPNSVTFGPGSTGSLALFDNSVAVSSLSSSGGTPIVENGGTVPATLTVNSSVNNTYGGALEDGFSKSLSLVKSGFGTLTLSGDSTYTGSTTINSSAVLQGGATNAFSAASAFNVASSGELNLGGFSQSIGSLTGGGLVTTKGSSGSDTLTVGNDNTNSTFSGVILDSGSGRSLALTKIGGGTLTLTGNNTFTGSVNINGGTLALSGGTLVPNVINSATFVYNSGSFSGRLTNQATAIFNSTFAPGNGMENDGAAFNAAGVDVTLNGTGLNNQGSLSMSGGILSVSASGTNSNGGSLSLTSPASLNLAAATLTNSGMLSLNGGSIGGAGGTLINSAGGTIFGTGTIIAAFSNNGSTLIVGSGPMNVVAAFSNSGLVQLTAVNSDLFGGMIANSATGAIEGIGVVGNSVTNNGTIESIGGALSVSGTLTNPGGGLLAVDAGSKLFITGGLATNAGVINLTGGTFDNSGHALSNTGQISGWGIFRAGGSGLDNNGNITFSGGLTTVNGPVTNESGKTITIAQNPAIFTGPVTNNGGGTFNTTNTTATFAGGFTNNGNSSFAAVGGGTLEIDAAPSLNTSSSLQVASPSTLLFKVVSGAAVIGTNVTATVASGATLELAGTVSALGTAGGNRAAIINSGMISVTGTGQGVGGIDNGSSSGTVELAMGASLTADHIIQGSLVIGSGATFTLAPSDSSGNPLVDQGLDNGAASSGLILAGALTPPTSFIASKENQLGAGSASFPPSTTLSGVSGATVDLIPEPSSMLLCGLGGLVVGAIAIRKWTARRPLQGDGVIAAHSAKWCWPSWTPVAHADSPRLSE